MRAPSSRARSQPNLEIQCKAEIAWNSCAGIAKSSVVMRAICETESKLLSTCNAGKRRWRRRMMGHPSLTFGCALTRDCGHETEVFSTARGDLAIGVSVVFPCADRPLLHGKALALRPALFKRCESASRWVSPCASIGVSLVSMEGDVVGIPVVRHDGPASEFDGDPPPEFRTPDSQNERSETPALGKAGPYRK